MDDSKIIFQKITEQISNAKYIGDIGDVGNEIGIVIGKYNKDDVEDFIMGLKHGISLSDGTH